MGEDIETNSLQRQTITEPKRRGKKKKKKIRKNSRRFIHSSENSLFAFQSLHSLHLLAPVVVFLMISSQPTWKGEEEYMPRTNRREKGNKTKILGATELFSSKRKAREKRKRMATTLLHKRRLEMQRQLKSRSILLLFYPTCCVATKYGHRCVGESPSAGARLSVI